LFGGNCGIRSGRGDQSPHLFHRPRQPHRRRCSSEQATDSIRIGRCKGFDRVKQHGGAELSDDASQKANACRADVDPLTAVRQEVPVHVEEITGNRESVASGASWEPLLKVFKVIAGIDPVLQFSVVASENETSSAKASRVSDESTQLRNAGPADQIEVNLIEQEPSACRSAAQQRRLRTLHSVLLTLGGLKIGLQTTPRDD